MKRIIVSRTDGIGDVALTLPLCDWIKSNYPNTTLVFLCKSYTSSVVSCFVPVDEILDYEELELMDNPTRNKMLKADLILHVFPNLTVAKWAKRAGINQRIGTSHRWFHHLYCNRLVSFTRKKSALHEAVLNFNLLKPLGLKMPPVFEEIMDVSASFQIQEKTKNASGPFIIIHPKSHGSAVEYPLLKYRDLAMALVKENYQVLITGTTIEKAIVGDFFDGIQGVSNVMGMYNLPQLIALIQTADGVIACSTGPLHLAGLMNRKAIGLFVPRIPIHPGRWKPLGSNSQSLVYNDECENCRKGKPCTCIENISTSVIINSLKSLGSLGK